MKKLTSTNKLKFAKGVTFIEVMMAASISLIPVFALAVLLIGGQRQWEKGFKRANRQIEIDGQTAAAIFGRVGRKSDRNNCKIQDISTSMKNLIVGEVVEFRYWGNKRTGNAGRSGQPPSSFSVEPTEYARFYLEENEKQLKIDYGEYPYGTQTRSAREVVIADNVTNVEFSRTTFNSIGQGNVRMELTLEDPDDGKTITIMASALMRN
jgi:hypothetical protein